MRRALLLRNIPALMNRGAALAAARREQLLAVLLWSAVAGVILLPALSQIGYPVWSAEYVLVTTAAIAAGLGCYLASKLKAAGVLLLITLTVISFLLYFGVVLDSLNVFLLALAGILVFIAFAVRRFEAALRISGFAAFAQIAAATFVTPSPVNLLVEKETPRSDAPAVIHILLDGHAGTAAFPESAVSHEDVKQLEEVYLSRGFTVFRRAYSADISTNDSMARLFNPTAEMLPVERDMEEGTYVVTRAKALEQIAERRALDLTFTNWLDLRPALKKVRNVARLRMFEMNERGNAPGVVDMPIADRLWIMAGGVKAWFMKHRSPLVVFFLRRTEAGRSWENRLNPAIWTNPLTGRSMLEKLAKRLECCGEKGTYTFLHVIYPHAPFIFDKTCTLLPIWAWGHRRDLHLGLETLDTQNERWRQHFEQVYCAALDVANFADTARRRDSLKDATIIVHGDHGSRIAIEDYEERKIQGYDRTDYDRGYRGTFFAVRLPGMPKGQTVETPIRIDDIYRQLLRNDFRRLDLETLKSRADSPYSYEAR